MGESIDDSDRYAPGAFAQDGIVIPPHLVRAIRAAQEQIAQDEDPQPQPVQPDQTPDETDDDSRTTPAQTHRLPVGGEAWGEMPIRDQIARIDEAHVVHGAEKYIRDVAQERGPHQEK